MLKYNIIRQPYRKTIAISISEDNQIVVKASKTLSKKYINDFVLEKQKWIKKVMTFNTYEKKPYQEKSFSANEKFLFLGKPLFLNIEIGNRKKVKIEDNRLYVFIPSNCKDTKKYVKNKLIDWYKEQSFKFINQRLNIYKKNLNLTPLKLKIKQLKSSWGSCSKSKIITMSWRVIMAPVEIIDYILVHELIHLIHHNHSSKFWNEVAKVFPNYKQLKKWLVINDNCLKF